MRWLALHFWFLTGLLSFATLVGVTTRTDGRERNAAHSIKVVTAVANRAMRPPTAGYQPATLPDDWQRTRPDAARDVVWYRVPLPAPTDPGSEAWAVYLPKVALHASVFLGDDWIGGTETGAGEIAHAPRRPWLFALPPGWHSSARDLYIRVSGLAEVRSGLGSVQVGPLSALRPTHEARMLWTVDLIHATNVAVCVLCIILAACARRREPELVWAALACALWVVASHHSIGGHALLPEPYWGALASWALGLAAIATLRFACLYVHWQSAWLVRASQVYAVLGLLAMVLFLSLELAGALRIWLIPLTTVPIAVSVIFIRHASNTRDPLALLLAAAGLLNTLLAVHDVMLAMGWLAFERTPLLPYGVVVFALCTGASLVRRYMQTAQSLQELNTTLAARVEEKRGELERLFARTQQLEAERARQEERERLTRDMHDGLGSQLISALSAVDCGSMTREDVASVLRECIDDMRLLVETMDPEATDLVTLLGNLRYRLAPRLAKTGIGMIWRVHERIGPPSLDATGRLDVLRIVQEAIANTLKHTKARTITLESDAEGNLAIEDDGQPVVTARAHPHPHGQGIANMHRRAQRCGARLTWQQGTSGGTRIELHWTPTAFP